MRALRKFLLLAAVGGLTLFGSHSVADSGTPQPGQPKVPSASKRPTELDRGKSLVIEPRLKKLVENGTAPAPQPPQPGPGVGPAPMGGGLPPGFQPPRVDFSKSGWIEPRLKGLVGQPGLMDPRMMAFINQPQGQAVAPPVVAPPVKQDPFVNPKVQPGKVRWHASHKDACAAAVKSKKPVLLFQMMGKLDDQFC